MWWIVNATPSQLKEIKGHKGIAFAAESRKAAESRAVHHNSERIQPLLNEDNDDKLGHSSTLAKKDSTQLYKAQLNAVKELRQLSIPKDVSDQDQWPDYVYQEAAGEGIPILHIEMVCVFFSTSSI